jgi:PAS domain S-box-containing protein
MSVVGLPATPVGFDLTRKFASMRPSRMALSTALALPPILIGAIVLLGWAVDSAALKRVLVGTIPVRPNAAAVMLLLAAAHLVLVHLRNNGKVLGISGILYALAGLVTAITVLEYVSGADFRIDAVLFKAGPDLTMAYPERMSLSAAVGLFLVAVGGATSVVHLPGRVTVVIASIAATVGGMAVLGHLYAADELMTGWGAGTSIALPTAICITVLASALLASPRVRGIHDVLGSRSPGGDVARVLLVGSLVLLPTLGILRETGERAGLFGFGFGLSIMVAVSVASLSSVGVFLGRRIDLADRGRRAAEDQFLRVIEQADDAICVIGRNGYFRDLNPAWTRLLGYEAEELKTRPFIDFVHPDDVDRTLAEWSDLIQGKSTLAFINRYRHQDGTYRSIEWSARISPDTGDVYGVARDVTARAEGGRERALLAAIVDSTDEAVVSTDLEGRILSWNRGATKLFGFAPDEILGADVRSLIPTERAAEGVARIAQITAGESVADWETVRVAKGGRRIDVLLTLSPLRDSNGFLIGSAAVERDITAIKAARERVEVANAELAARNAELRDFASVVSHDLRAPLRRLQMFADMAVDAPGKDADVTDLLLRIRSSADSMEALVVDLLTYARLGASGTAMRPVDLEAIVADALEEMQPTLVESHALVDVGDLPTIDGDPILLRQLFTNLLGNAVKFRTPGVNPVISVTARASTAPSAIEIEVRDNGIGFDASFADRIFRIFERLSTDTPGTGVGLAICRKITDLHRGTIEASSSPGNGATFSIRLPITQPKELA